MVSSRVSNWQETDLIATASERRFMYSAELASMVLKETECE